MELGKLLAGQVTSTGLGPLREVTLEVVPLGYLPLLLGHLGNMVGSILEGGGGDQGGEVHGDFLRDGDGVGWGAGV